MNLCPPGCLYLVHSLVHSLMETWVPLYSSVFVSQSSHFCCLHLVQNVFMHQYMNLCLPYTPCLAPPPMDSYMESWSAPMLWSLYVCPSHPNFCCYTLFRMCTMHQYMNLCPPDYPCLFHPLCTVLWNLVCPYVSLCVSQSPCMWSPVLFRMCAWMSTWIYVHLGAHPICIVSWSLRCPYVSLCPQSHLPHFFFHTLFRMCTCISTWIYVYLTPHVWSTLLWIVTWKVGCPCVSLHVCPSHLIFVATPCLECVHASVHEFMSTWLLMSGPPPMHSLMETWVPLYGSVFLSQVISFLLPHLV